ncbi:MAG: NADH-quinone oxidoreductase subunit D [Planctomycetota bacterium]
MPFELKPYDVDVETTPYVESENWSGQGDRWTLNFGPQHPATHTTLRLVLELDGERIVRCVPHIGYLHSGFEKLGEALDYNQYVTIVSRMNYISPIANDICWHGAVEKLFDIDLTPRCKVVRTICAELVRIQDHLMSVGASALDLGAFTGFLYGFNEREKIYDIWDYIAGQRYHPDYTRVGGTMADLPDQKVFVELVHNFLDNHLAPALDDLEGLLFRNRIFRDRTEGIGTVTPEEAIAWSLTGPLARSAGVTRDLRKDEPYLCYADNWDGQGSSPVTFKVPLATTGDCWGRFLVRFEEMRQSAHIVRQLIDDIPGGPMNADDDGKMVKPPKSAVYGSIEGLIQHFELVMTNRKWKAPINEVYGAHETANGELGYTVVSDGGPKPWRVKTRPPSFINYACFSKMLEGHMIADIPAIMGSINVIAAELDR